MMKPTLPQVELEIHLFLLNKPFHQCKTLHEGSNKTYF